MKMAMLLKMKPPEDSKVVTNLKLMEQVKKILNTSLNLTLHLLLNLVLNLTLNLILKLILNLTLNLTLSLTLNLIKSLSLNLISNLILNLILSLYLIFLDNGLSILIENHFDWHNMFVGQYSVGDIGYKVIWINIMDIRLRLKLVIDKFALRVK